MNSPTPAPQMAQSDEGSELYLEIPESVLQSMRDRYDTRSPNAYSTPILIANGGGDPTPTPTSSGSSGSSSGQGGPIKECDASGAGPTGFSVSTMNNMPNTSNYCSSFDGHFNTGHSTVRIDIDQSSLNLIPENLRQYANKTIGMYPNNMTSVLVNGSSQAKYNLDDGLTENEGCRKNSISLQSAINGLQKIHDKSSSDDLYYRDTYNCSHFALDVARSAGMNIPDATTIKESLCPNSNQTLTPGMLGKHNQVYN